MIQGPIRKGDICIYDFGIVGKERPVVIIQNNVANKFRAAVIIAKLTTNADVGKLPVGVEVSPGQSGLRSVSYINLGDIYTVEKIHLSSKLGSIPHIKIKEINKALKYSLDIE